MKILQLCMRVPFPPSDGATIAMYNLSKSFYENGVQLKILAFNTNKSYVENNKISISFREKTKIETVKIDLSIKLLPAFLNFIRNKSYHIARFTSEEFNFKLKKILSEDNYDVVQFEGLYLSSYIETVRKLSAAKIILRAHNIEYVIWERLAASTKNFIKKKYLKILASQLKRYELKMWNEYDAVVPITIVDKAMLEKMQCRVPLQTAPLGIDTSEYSFCPDVPGQFSVFHLGSMDWMPNIEAVEWFLKHVYKELIKKIPDIKIYLAGKNMPSRIKSMAEKNLIIEDAISDSKKYLFDKSVMIVPLLSGGGMRVKIIEGMALGKPVVSTAIGAEGINYTRNENILIAETPQQFCDAIFKLKTDKDFYRLIAKNARELVEKEYDNAAIAKDLLSFYGQQIKKAT